MRSDEIRSGKADPKPKRNLQNDSEWLQANGIDSGTANQVAGDPFGQAVEETKQHLDDEEQDTFDLAMEETRRRCDPGIRIIEREAKSSGGIDDNLGAYAERYLKPNLPKWLQDRPELVGSLVGTWMGIASGRMITRQILKQFGIK